MIKIIITILLLPTLCFAQHGITPNRSLLPPKGVGKYLENPALLEIYNQDHNLKVDQIHLMILRQVVLDICNMKSMYMNELRSGKCKPKYEGEEYLVHHEYLSYLHMLRLMDHIFGFDLKWDMENQCFTD